ncbi:pentapeptide repeat-containing protein [Nocardia sp. NEAU-G5]|uniref:Pentapeptide repeat-containing protein n=1 Tax=Nocardia albiluteola TaxID=2842303 RepID=A0ABS6AYQ0_9NOCA|nr:pentapeptide repeat-containing protein [Nocardia albiluteola]MBU3062655.1 pentapeptide repeat-containing protein [Nocardia albiluteola]MBU3065511.1 pentapeptide repeat-containing protein [Nocardia albiluteola]
MSLLVVVSGLLLADSTTSHSDALRTGGLAAGSVIALYALWLNDRRRRVEEDRQRTERERYNLELLRAERDRDRVTDERFAKSVELLGSDADQVRVGALHALAGVSRGRRDYTQTVLDVICSYLRRPFDHPEYLREHAAGEKPDAVPDRAEAERELQVRLTAQRLVAQLLPPASSPGPSYDLDLTGACVAHFDLSGRKVGSLTMRNATFHDDTDLGGCVTTGPAQFTAATVGDGRFRCRDTVFHDRVWFNEMRFGGLADFAGTRFMGETTFKQAVFESDADFQEVVFEGPLDLFRVRFEGHLDMRFAAVPPTVAFYNTQVNPQREIQLPPGWEPVRRDGLVRLSVVADARQWDGVTTEASAVKAPSKESS